MAIRIVPHADDLRPAVEAFNRRMRDGGSRWGFYVEPECDWIPKRPGRVVWREHHVAVDEGGAMRGGFTLKPQDWWVHGATTVVTDWQGPVSEGSIDPKYSALAIRLMREMTKRRPALYSWGHGENDQPVVQLVGIMGWSMHETPFCLLVLKPHRFLRHNAYLRQSKGRRLALDLLAFSGIGWAALRALHGALRLRSYQKFTATASVFDEYDSWADELWERCKHRYSAIAVRNTETMKLLAPQKGWPPVTRLRIEKSGEPIGWSLVMSTKMTDDSRFGDLHVGSLVDCLADPADAGEVVWATTQFLRSRGVDIIVSNQTHPAWIRGFAQSGYLILPNRRLFVASPELRQTLEPFEETVRGLHLTNMDGHGPHAL